MLAAEAELGHTGGDDLGDALVRFESLREKARGLAAVLAERRRGIDRERGAFVDQAVIATLEAEATRLAAELADADGRDRRPRARSATSWPAPRARCEEARTAFERDWADGVPALTGRAAEGRGELAALRSGVERGAQELARATSRLATLEEKLARLDAEAARLRAEADGRGGRRGRRSSRSWPPPSSSEPPPSSRSPTPRPPCAPPTAIATRGRPGRRR